MVSVCSPAQGADVLAADQGQVLIGVAVLAADGRRVARARPLGREDQAGDGADELVQQRRVQVGPRLLGRLQRHAPCRRPLPFVSLVSFRLSLLSRTLRDIAQIFNESITKEEPNKFCGKAKKKSRQPHDTGLSFQDGFFEAGLELFQVGVAHLAGAGAQRLEALQQVQRPHGRRRLGQQTQQTPHDRLAGAGHDAAAAQIDCDGQRNGSLSRCLGGRILRVHRFCFQEPSIRTEC